MDKKINTLIKNYSDNADLMNKLVVTAFLRCHNLEAGMGFLAQFVDKKANAEVSPSTISLEDVITIFELAIPGSERTANGAVYTPSYIRNYIVGQVLHSIAKPLDECLCADIACGSGAFLLETYQLLNDLLIDYYIQYDTTKLVQIDENSYRLKFVVKKALLTSCIYGVDKDFNAAEACKFGLLLKLLENEDSASLMNERPILPDLAANIQFGNSLLSSQDINPSDSTNINPFDFGLLRFDAIIGNPSYLTTEGMKNITPKELPLYKKILCMVKSSRASNILFL